jgi:hypothetical protein
MTEVSSALATTTIESQVIAWTTEYASIRDEINRDIDRQHQTIVYTLAAASVAIPLVSTLFDRDLTLPPFVIPAVLYSLAIFISVVIMTFATSMYKIAVAAKYLHEYVEPEVNLLLSTQGPRRLLGWESFLRQHRRRFPEITLASIGLGGVIFVSLFSGIALLGIGDQLSSQATASVIWLGRIAWILFLISILWLGVGVNYTATSVGHRSTAPGQAGNSSSQLSS